MAHLVLLNKPFNVLCQFSDTEGRNTLADSIDIKRFPQFYPAGRLDYDSEGLVLLTNDGALQHRITHPESKFSKTYWVQIEGEPNNDAINTLQKGVKLKDGLTRPAKAERIPEPEIWPRTPPIRQRLNQPTSWLELTISEGKNRQVRRMTASVGHPTLRLIRAAIGHWSIQGLSPGEFKTDTIHLPNTNTKIKPKTHRVKK